MISHLKVKPTQEFILNLINEAVEIERAFLNEAVPASLLNLTNKFVNQTIEKRASLLKYETLKAFDTTSKMKSQESGGDAENLIQSKKASKQITFDEDF